jgi:hypothetical protein
MSLSEFYIHVGKALSCINDSHTRVERPTASWRPRPHSPNFEEQTVGVGTFGGIVAGSGCQEERREN